MYPRPHPHRASLFGLFSFVGLIVFGIVIAAHV
jgi:hypothetical protein